jgi:hypothetical protein
MTKHDEHTILDNGTLSKEEEKKKSNDEKIKQILLILKGMTATDASSLLYKVGQQMVVA